MYGCWGRPAGSLSKEIGAVEVEYAGMSIVVATSGIGLIEGDSMYDVWLLTRRRRDSWRESRRARSCWRLSSRCSGVKTCRGGLEVKELVTLGGVRLGSDPVVYADV